MGLFPVESDRSADGATAADVLLIADGAMLAHDPGLGHPERPERLRAILDALRASPVSGTRLESASPATRTMLERVHTRAHIDHIESLRGRSVQIDADTRTSPESVGCAFLAAGAGVAAAEAVVRGRSPRAFALVRPPGHHAEADRAMGFCFFNNVGVAAAHALAELGCGRVLIIDWDVHHANGTQHIFEDRRDVMVFSVHEEGNYPGTGAAEEVGRDEGIGFTVNVPLPTGCGDDDYEQVFDDLLAPIAAGFRPDLVLASAGFDAHARDPLGGMRLSEVGFASLCARARAIAERHAGGRMALVLEGGYELGALSGSVRACVRVLAAARAPEPGGPGRASGDGARRVIERVRANHECHWPLLARR